MNNLRKAIKLLLRDPRILLLMAVSRVYNALFVPRPRVYQTESIYLNNIIDRVYQSPSDISDHLVTLFLESLSTSPKLIVELGVRGGESTFVLERVARLTGAQLVSVDIADCSNISSYERWTFVQMDDIAFAQQFKSWCQDRGIDPQIDILFIDTSHLLDHTIQEIEHWLPLTSPTARVMFHDSNLRHVYFRKDGSMGVTAHQHRGVIGALEHYFQKQFNEKIDFVDLQRGWLIKHYAASTGFTILERSTRLDC